MERDRSTAMTRTAHASRSWRRTQPTDGHRHLRMRLLPRCTPLDIDPSRSINLTSAENPHEDKPLAGEAGTRELSLGNVRKGGSRAMGRRAQLSGAQQSQGNAARRSRAVL